MATWLEQVNGYRALANLPPVTENLALSAAARNLAEYLVNNVGHLSHLDGQTENPNYTAAQNSNLWGSSDPNAPDSQAIEEWSRTLFFFIQLLSPGLQPVGFGSYRTTAPTPDRLKMAAAITVPSSYRWDAIPHLPVHVASRGKDHLTDHIPA